MFKAVKNEQSEFLFDAAKSDELFLSCMDNDSLDLPSNLD